MSQLSWSMNLGALAMSSLSFGLSCQAKAMRKRRVMPCASTWLPLRRPWVCASGLLGLSTATSNSAGGGGGRGFVQAGWVGSGRLVDLIDDDDGSGVLLQRELEAELLLDGVEDSKAVGRGFPGPVEVEVVAGFQVGGVDHGLGQVLSRRSPPGPRGSATWACCGR